MSPALAPVLAPREATTAPVPAAPAPPPTPIRVSLALGSEARSLLAAPDFGAEWDALAAACPWATVFQRRGFASIWMDVYGDQIEPVVVSATDETGRLAGLLVLVTGDAGKTLHLVGTHQNEYQTWLARPEHGERFIVEALDLLRAEYPHASLTLMHVPPAAPLGWAAGHPEWSRRIVVETMSRALRDLSEEDQASLRKRGNKSRLRQLERKGEVKFERITDRADYLRLLDELIPIHDFRQGAVHGILPFEVDARKRLFHEKLFDLPDFLYVTSLRAGKWLVAAQLGIADGKMLSVGPHSYAAEFARQSPGKIHLHLLAGHLAAEGFATLDLTPGAGWKDRFATRQDEVSIVRIFFDGAGRRRFARSRAIDALAKKVAIRAGWTPDEVRAFLANVRRHGVLGTVTAAARRVAGRLRPRTTRSVVVWTAAPTAAAGAAAGAGLKARFRVDSVEDLLLYRPTERWESRTAFLSQALARLSAGHRCYTLVEDGKLVCRGWLTEPANAGGGSQPSHPSEVAATIPVPGDVAIAYDFHTVPEARGRGLREAGIAQAIADAAAMPDCRKVWIGCDGTDRRTAELLRTLGFTELTTLRMDRVFGKPVVHRDHRALHVQPTPFESAALAAKRAVFRVAKAAGLFRVARMLTARELRVLCWHGFDLTGESEFGPRLFEKKDTFERRLDHLVAAKYPVLPLDRAVDLLAAGRLPQAAVVLTLDDGAASVPLRAAAPLAQRKLPATLYVTTYHVDHPTPVFETSLRYLLWKSPAPKLDLSGVGPYAEGEVDLADENGVRAVTAALVRYAKEELDEPGRQALGREIAKRLQLDWDEHAASRRCSLATPEELRALADQGIDLQLHTHRHRFPADEADTFREILDNRTSLERIRPGRYDHLCYPSGEYDPSQFPWLRGLGVRSGTTCEVGLNPRGTNPMALRRFLDGECVSEIEFEAEVSGFAELCRRAARKLRRR